MIIEVKDLIKQFGKKIVLDNVNLKIYKGDIFGIVGMSGSGKTTLLNSLIGFLQPDDGDILFLSDKKYKSIFKNMRNVKNNFGFSPQHASYYPNLTVEENLEHFASLYKLKKKVKKNNKNHLLKLTELDEARKTLGQFLSGGMQKRLGIACALVHKPKILILDEPISDLDPVLRREIKDLIKQINEQGTTIIIASHLLNDIQNFCNRIAVLHKNKIVEVGSPNELKNIYSKNEEIHLETSPGKYSKIIKKLKHKKLPIEKVVNHEHKVIIYTQRAETVLHNLLHIIEDMNETLLDVNVDKPSLAEVFEFVTKSEK